MAAYIIRVVLHGATAAQYAALHKGMLNGGAKRTILGANGLAFDLPDGEYVLSSSLVATKIRDIVADIARAAKTSPDPSLIVAAYTDIAWQLRPVPGQS